MKTNRTEIVQPEREKNELEIQNFDLMCTDPNLQMY